MARPKKYGRFTLSEDEVEYLTAITNTRTAEAQKVQRAQNSAPELGRHGKHKDRRKA